MKHHSDSLHSLDYPRPDPGMGISLEAFRAVAAIGWLVVLAAIAISSVLVVRFVLK